MKLYVEFNDLVGSRISKAFISKHLKKTLEQAGNKIIKNKKITVSVAIVGEKEIKSLNKKYRKNNRETDILSFSEYKNARELSTADGKNIFLGELILCYNNIVKYSREQRLNVRQELARVISHGTLHLLGFKHGKKMFDVQEKVATRINK